MPTGLLFGLLVGVLFVVLVNMNDTVSRAEIRGLIPSISIVNGVNVCINSGSHLVDRWLPFGIPSDIPTLNNFLIK